MVGCGRRRGDPLPCALADTPAPRVPLRRVVVDRIACRLPSEVTVAHRAAFGGARWAWRRRLLHAPRPRAPRASAVPLPHCGGISRPLPLAHRYSCFWMAFNTDVTWRAQP